MDERSDRGDFYPGGNGGGGVPPGTDTDKVDRISLGEVGESYTLKDVKNKVNQIVRAIAPVAVCLAGLALCVAGLCASTSRAATAPLEDLPNTATVVTNEEDAVAMAAVGALGEALSNDVAELSSAFNARLGGATNALTVQMAALRSADSNRIEATYAKLADIPAQPDLSPYALKGELPQDYLTENDITNLATRAWIAGQGYATQAGVGARLDAQDLAIDGIRIVASDSNAVTRLVTADGLTWQDATGVVWQVGAPVWQSTTNTVEFVEWLELPSESAYQGMWDLDFNVNGDSSHVYTNAPSMHEGEIVIPAGAWWYHDKEDEDYGDFPVTFVLARTTNAIDRVLYASGGGGGGSADLTPATNYTDQVAARKQDALPYPTNAIPYAAISGGGAEWRVVAQECSAIGFVTNGMSVVRFANYDPLQFVDGVAPENSGWPDGAAMFSRWLIASEGVSGYYPAAYMRLAGGSTWPTNDCQCVLWRSGTNIFVNILVEEGP